MTGRRQYLSGISPFVRSRVHRQHRQAEVLSRYFRFPATPRFYATNDRSGVVGRVVLNPAARGCGRRRATNRPPARGKSVERDVGVTAVDVDPTAFLGDNDFVERHPASFAGEQLGVGWKC